MVVPEGKSEPMPSLRVKSERAQLPSSMVRRRIVVGVHGQGGLHVVCFVSSEASPTGSGVIFLCGLGWMLMSSQHLSQFSDALGVAISGRRVLLWHGIFRGPQ